MSSSSHLQEVFSQFQTIIKKPDRFLVIQDDSAKETKRLLKTLYDFLKVKEKRKQKTSQALPELIVNEFDEEQIWQEIDLQNEAISNSVVTDVAHLLAKKDRLVFNTTSENSEGESDDDEEQEDDVDDQSGDEDEEDLEENSGGSEDEVNSNSDGEDNTGKLKFVSEVDDEFFKLSEMENFCEEVEKEEDTGKPGGFDLFGAVPSDDDDAEEKPLIRYNDFFGKPKRKQKEKKRDSHESEDDFNDGEDEDLFAGSNFGKSKKKVQFQEDEDALEENLVLDRPDESDDSDDGGSSKKDDGPKSAFEARQDRLKARIGALEEEALREKPWHLQGEASAAARPHNSLLEEFVEFDRATRPAPVFTEKTTLRLEDIIRQRVKDKSWDDVVRKVKPVEDVREYRKQLVLNQEKSKLSLAEVYEQEYVKQRDAAAAQPGEEKPETEPPEHTEITKMIKSLFSKLDALSNFHYTPKPVAPEVRIVSNLPAISMEDVAPVATSDAALLAPEEVKDKKKGELLGKSDRTTTDKKRERRQKKSQQRKRQQEKLKKDKLMSKMSLGLGNKYSKEKAKRTLDELTKERNVDKMVETQGKHMKSSTAFFSKLEDQVKGQLKRKGVGSDTKRKKSMGTFSAKRIKL